MPTTNIQEAQRLLDTINMHFKTEPISQKLKDDVSVQLRYIAENKAADFINTPTTDKLLELLDFTLCSSAYRTININDMLESNTLLKDYIKTLLPTYRVELPSFTYDM